MKKILLVIIILFSLNTFSQTEENKIEEKKSESTIICQTVDEFSDEKSVNGIGSVVWYEDGGDMKSEGMNVMLFLSEKKGKIELSTLYVKVVGIKGCVDIGSTLDIIFENGSKTQLVNWKKFNCEGKNYFEIKGKEDLFKSSNINAIKYTNKRNYNSMIVKENMGEEGKSYLKNILLEVDKINDGLLIVGKCE